MRMMYKKQRKEFSSLYIFFQRIRRLGNINGNRVPTKVFQIIMDDSTVSHYIPSCVVVIVFEKIYICVYIFQCIYYYVINHFYF